MKMANRVINLSEAKERPTRLFQCSQCGRDGWGILYVQCTMDLGGHLIGDLFCLL